MSRFHIVMPSDLKDRMKKIIPSGFRSDFIRSAISMAVDAIEEHGPAFLGLMLAGEVVFRPNSKINQKDGQNSTTPEEGN